MSYRWQVAFLLLTCSFSEALGRSPGAAGNCSAPEGADKTLAGLPHLIDCQAARNHATRASFAVTINGRLVSTGVTPGKDKLPDNVSLSPGTLFRIASLSKPLTAAAIYALAGTHREYLDNKPFLPMDKCAHKEGGFCGLLSGLVPPELSEEDRRKVEKITIQHLIDHTAGWNRDACVDANNTSVNWSHDPVFDCLLQDPQITRTHLITKVISSRLSAEPGDWYQYSNFGYVVLGEVIREYGGGHSTYEERVKKLVLEPAGIHDMKLGTNTPPPLPGEVDEYRNNGSRMLSMQLMEASGGWLASPTDLVRWLDYMNGQRGIQRVSKLQGNPVPPTGFRQTWAYYGTLPGTTAILHLEPIGPGGNRISWAVLFNGRDEANGQPEDEAQREDEEIAKLLRKIDPDDWPGNDLFGEDTQTTEQLKESRFDDQKVDANLFLHDFWGRFGRAWEYDFNRVQQPPFFFSGTTGTFVPNPESYLNQHTMKFQFAELFPSPTNLANAYKTLCSPAFSRSNCDASTFRKVASGGGWFQRSTSGLSASVDLAERVLVSGTTVVPNPSFWDHYQVTATVDWDPSQLFLSGTNWKIAEDLPDASSIAETLCDAGNLADCTRRLSSPRLSSLQPGQRAKADLLAALIPRFEFKKISQLDFLRSSGILVPATQRALNSFSFNWDLKKVIPTTTSRLDAYNALVGGSSGGAGASNSKTSDTKLCVIKSGPAKSFINVPPEFVKEACASFAAEQQASYALGCIGKAGISVSEEADARHTISNFPPSCGWK